MAVFKKKERINRIKFSFKVDADLQLAERVAEVEERLKQFAPDETWPIDDILSDHLVKELKKAERELKNYQAQADEAASGEAASGENEGVNGEDNATNLPRT